MAWTPRGTPFTASDTIASLALSLSSTRAPTAGDLMQVGIGVRNSDTVTITSIVDDQGGTWTRFVRYATAGEFVELWGGVAAASANTVITVTFSAAVQSNGYAQAIGSSVGSWFKQDEATGATSAGTTHTPGTVDAAAGDLLSTMTSVATAYTLGALATDYSQVGTMTRALAQRRIAAGTITVDGAWTTTAAEDTVSAHVVLREGTGSLTSTSTAATASWVTPTSTASIPGSATSTAASAAWSAPASAAAPGAVTSTSTASTARWVAREATSAPGAVASTSTVATAAWTVPASSAAPGAVTASSTVATATWDAPASTANLTGAAASTAAVASWVAPASSASPGAIGATSTVTTAAWTAPASAAAPGAVGATSTAASTSWAVPASTASASGLGATSTAASASWSAPTSTAAGAAVTVSSIAALASWTVPASTAVDGSAPVYPSLAVGAARAGVATFTVRTHLTE